MTNSDPTYKVEPSPNTEGEYDQLFTIYRPDGFALTLGLKLSWEVPGKGTLYEVVTPGDKVLHAGQMLVTHIFITPDGKINLVEMLDTSVENPINFKLEKLFPDSEG